MKPDWLKLQLAVIPDETEAHYWRRHALSRALHVTELEQRVAELEQVSTEED